jgi:hypothetical protein
MEKCLSKIAGRSLNVMRANSREEPAMTHTKNGAAVSSGTSSLVVYLTGRRKHLHSWHPHRPKNTLPAPTTIYVFPSRPTKSPRRATPLRDTEHPVQQKRGRQELWARLPRWIHALTTWHALMLGAAACYLLIIFNLVYGLTSLAQLKAWRPLQAVSAADPQRRALAAPVECEPAPSWPAASVPTARIASVLCATDLSFGGTLDDIFPRRPVTREPRSLHTK